MAESHQRWLYSPRKLPSAEEVILAATEGGNPKIATFRLVQAVLRREWDVFQELLPNININEKDKFGFTPLLRAVQKDRPEYLDAILTRDDLELVVADQMNRTALHVACEARRFDALRTLLNHARQAISDEDRCLWIDTQDNHGTTALASAIARGHKPMAKALLEAGGSSSITDVKGHTALYIACGRGHLDLVELLLGDNDPEFIPPNKRSELGAAIMKNRAKVVDFLLGHRPHIDLSRLHGNNEQKWTYLQWAAYKDNLDVVSVLLDHQAPVWVLDEAERSVFDLPKISVKAKRLMRPRVLEQLMDGFVTSPLCLEFGVPPEVGRIVLWFAYH